MTWETTALLTILWLLVAAAGAAQTRDALPTLEGETEETALLLGLPQLEAAAALVLLLLLQQTEVLAVPVAPTCQLPEQELLVRETMAGVLAPLLVEQAAEVAVEGQQVETVLSKAAHLTAVALVAVGLILIFVQEVTLPTRAAAEAESAAEAVAPTPKGVPAGQAEEAEVEPEMVTALREPPTRAVAVAEEDA